MIVALGSNPLNSVVASDGRFIVELANEKEVLSLMPDFLVLKNYEMVVVTSQAEPSSAYDFISRSFVRHMELTRTRLLAPRTVPWLPTGLTNWGKIIYMLTRHRQEAGH
jgi:hypothetical protein